MDKKLSEILDREFWELKYLEEIAVDIYIGNGIKKEELGTGTYPAIKCGDINSKLPIQFTECVSFVDENLIKNKKYFEHGDIVVSGLGDKKTIGKACVYLGIQKCLVGKEVWVIKHNQNLKYLSYVLSTEYCRRQVKKLVKEGIIFNFSLTKMKQIKIPLPTLEEQEEIVKKLDKFYDLVGDLEFGIPWLIKANRDQYEYYKNQIIRI